MKEEQIKFGCDNKNCNTIIFKKASCGFPYELGWVYIYKFNIQRCDSNHKVNPERIEKDDMHFCSKECAVIELKDTILGAE